VDFGESKYLTSMALQGRYGKGELEFCDFFKLQYFDVDKNQMETYTDASGSSVSDESNAKDDEC